MRPWIKYLLANPSATADFIEWAASSELELATLSLHAVRAGDHQKATDYASEHAVYEKIRKMVEKEAREVRAQLAYNQGERS